ncbi:LysM peptidoglycan-binding domain-containing protein [Algibacter amylolyticus]|uniref:LysM peptidoglycan-binding domain-containing protein n=1 Tax=Algibacter amylolyticus TaxID=1608400 RepID=A0A5M7B7Y8_9FLAO|nr:LysM peptidoglycan-binding domain-containing protein [Algibacter amylolyticus]KAA5823495.1 LysM peptidoglycan-binding domain-containing protein [Algibacter amylolyticus]MBB5267646.1 LysM repeat protein [Algibacter amylolyticus]TSJ73983.1 LysM peptidoglycan-binding domain-containing protein [Algibacter amylolyticus]
MNRFLLVLFLVLAFGFTTVQAQNFSTHQVKNGETVEGIAKRYFVTTSDIYKLNPDAKKALKPNTVLIIPISKANRPKVTVDKQLIGFTEHKTKRKETLYSLAKKYKISEDDIKKHNKFLYANPLKKGDKLQIPQFKITETVEEVATTKTYTVKPKEGKWRIAYKFGVTVDELETLNPNMPAVLNEGAVINVPNLEAKEQKQFDDKYSYYKVLPKEGFYRLKLKLGLEQGDIEALNPGLKETGLKSGMILKIPHTTNVATANSNELGGAMQEGEARDLSRSISNLDTKHIAVMLPFRMHRVDFDSVSDIKSSLKRDPYLDVSLDFHSGVLMALDSLKTLGVSLKVDVYDTRYEVSEVSRILRENNFENVDAVIGPLTPASFNKVALELKPYNVPVISPIGTNLKLHDNVFQSRPSNDLLKDKVVNFVKSDSTASNIIIIADTKNITIANSLKREFNAAKIVYSRKNKDGKDEFFVTKEDIEGALKPGKNMVFLETQNEGYASNVTSVLASLNNKVNPEKVDAKATEIVLLTTNINSAFEGDQINNSHLSSLQFHFAAASKEYSENDNNSFVKAYEKQYNITPNKRAVKGFDLTMDVVLRLVSSTDLYASVISAPLTEYVENKFAYKKKIFGGYYNDSVYLVKYDDLTIVEVK